MMREAKAAASFEGSLVSCRDDELVAADAGNRVARAHTPEQALRHLLQKRIAYGMAERIVDRLEAIEIEAQKRDLLLTAPAQRRIQPLPQEDAVGEIGERIVPRHVRDPGLVAVALGQIADGIDLVSAHAGAKLPAYDLDRNGPAVGGLQPRFLGRGFDCRWLEVKIVQQIARHVRADELFERPAA
jgi:hypothetical protein